MNVKTTLVLGLVFALLALGYVSLRKSAPPTNLWLPAPVTQQGAITKNLLAEPLGNLVKIAAKRKGGDEWVFEKKDSGESAAGPVWFMTKPTEIKALSYEVDRIGREVGRVQYEISYKEGEAGAVPPASAGFSPPEATIALTDDKGKTASVEIGNPVSESETYVRLVGGDQIVVAKSNLRSLLKTRALDYRDQQLWSFPAEKATRVEFLDRSTPDNPVTYAFGHESGQWMMESPATARATGKVDEMLRGFCRLRVAQWEDEDRGKLAVYGLDPAELDIKVTVEETVPVKKDAGESESAKGQGEEVEKQQSPATEKKTSVYELHIAGRSPIGEDAKVYVRADDDPVVGTIFKTTTDKFKPAVAEWRDMQITSADATKSTRVELNILGQSNALALRDGQWVFESGGAQAEQRAVAELLAAIKGLKAVAFVDKPESETALGFASPQADIRMTIPGVEGVERVTVGAFSDPTTRRLVYVRHNDGVVSKVKSDDLNMLLRSALAYRDRTAFDLPAERIRRVTVSTANKFTGTRGVATFERTSEVWAMTSPVSAPVRDDQVTKLVSTLASLKARSVAAESGEASAFGLTDPAAVVTITFLPPPDIRVEEAPATDSAKTDDGNAKNEADGNKDAAADKTRTPHAKPVEVERPAQEFELAVTEHGGQFYAMRKDRRVVYEVEKTLYDQLIAEYRLPEVLVFEPKNVRKISIRRGEETQVFTRSDSKWTFEAERDLPIDSAKLEGVLANAKDLKTDRYVVNKLDDPAKFGLAKPYYEFTITQGDNAAKTLFVADKTSDSQSPPMHFATVADGSGVFLLGEDAIQKVFLSLGDIEKK